MLYRDFCPSHAAAVRRELACEHRRPQHRIQDLAVEQGSVWYLRANVVDIDLTQTYLQVCCKPNRDIFEIVHSFLANPFFQINEYTCPQAAAGFKVSQITLPSLGFIQMNHSLVAYPQCPNNKGKLGLNKNSIFLNYLPINAQTIRISINDKNDLSKNKVTISFGGIQDKLENAWVFSTWDQNNWDITAKSIELGNLAVHQ